MKVIGMPWYRGQFSQVRIKFILMNFLLLETPGDLLVVCPFINTVLAHHVFPFFRNYLKINIE